MDLSLIKMLLMPSFVNIGAYVGGTMVDTWATVGSCAQIGSMFTYLEVGIGGVLEPPGLTNNY